VRWWNAHVQNTGVKLYISLGDYRYAELEEPDMEIARQVEFARSELAYCGCVHYGYTEIKNNTKGLLDELRSLHSRKVVCARVKSNGNPLVISTPQDGTYIDGDYSYIIGSCDPASTLLFNGSKVSLTKSGCFSVQTDLEPGLNEIKFVCDGKEYTHRLYSYKPGPGGYTVMEKYSISTYYPKTEVIVPSGSSFTVSCNAPTDSTVTATLAGKTIVLRPLLGNTGPEPYIAEIYRGTFDFAEYSEGTFDTLGTVMFRAERNGESAEATGAEFKVLGRNTVIPVEVVNDYAYLQADTDSTFYENCVPQVPGMTEFAVAKKEGFYELRNGKFISEKDVKTSGCVKDPGKFTLRQLLQTSSDSENYSVFLVKTAGSKPAVDAKLDGKKFTVTLFNSYVSDTAVTKGVFSPVVKDVVLKNDAENGNAVISIELYDELNFYGYSFDYIKLESVELFALYINNQPEISEGDPILAGKTIVLDAGHGGVDKGALGAFGAEGGKNEADINLSVVL
ncbi:MAG: N-acetylmuramoyl-L-alanine amidase, partial [Clostridia bacterium]|nr:N-acetylmuramoyl-L-alanine amidase [Clostridia bacterium]